MQGAAGSRFIYINVGGYSGQQSVAWNGRMKIPLPEEDINSMLAAEDGVVFTCRVAATTQEGKPVYATIKPFSGWKAERP